MVRKEVAMQIKYRAYFVLISLFLTPLVNHARDITLYDESGEVVAWIDTDRDNNIHLWGGEAVAYLYGQSIYGFNGQHLGWFKKGIVRDHDGCQVGFEKGALNKQTRLEGFRFLRKNPPQKASRQLPPFEPLPKNQWSKMSLASLLTKGRR